MKTELTQKQLNILRHTIGYDDAGNDRYPRARSLDERRNHFVTGPGSIDFEDCQILVGLGLMVRYPKQWLDGDFVFQVTSDGRDLVLENRPPKLTRSQSRYRQYLDGLCDLTFGQWLKQKRYQ